jgi:phosphoserine phosphatase
MVQIVLIRPGTTDYDQQGRIQGSLDIPLNAEGNNQIIRLAAEIRDLGIETLYYSDCQPASQTASVIADALNLKSKKLSNMQNLNHGLWQGMLIEDVKHKQPKVYRQWQEQPESIRPPEGEILAEAQERIDPALTKLLKKHKTGVIGMVAPEPLASLVRARLQDCDVGDLWQAATDHGSWEVIQVEPHIMARS